MKRKTQSKIDFHNLSMCVFAQCCDMQMLLKLFISSKCSVLKIYVYFTSNLHIWMTYKNLRASSIWDDDLKLHLFLKIIFLTDMDNRHKISFFHVFEKKIIQWRKIRLMFERLCFTKPGVLKIQFHFLII